MSKILTVLPLWSMPSVWEALHSPNQASGFDMATPRAAGARRLLTILQNATQPVFVLDAGLRIVYVNTAWEALTGHTAETVSGLECRPPDCDPHGSPETLVGSLRPPSEVQNGEPASATVLVVRPTGEHLWRRVDYWPLQDEHSALAGVIAIVSGQESAHLLPTAPSSSLRTELLVLREKLRSRQAPVDLVGQVASHRRLLDQVATAAATSFPVLIVGEAGSGKRHVSRAIHGRSARSHGPFVIVDAAALSPEDLERELFPRDPVDLPAGLGSSGSTLALGDLNDIPRDIQARLAADLQGERPPQARSIVLTAGDPDAALRDGRLRPDLYYAVTGLVIRLAPLRERLDDIPLLSQHFLERANGALAHRKQGITPAALEILRSYDWPGNLAELVRVIESAAACAEGDLVTPADLPREIQGHLGSAYDPPPMPSPVTPLDQSLVELERRLIERALRSARQRKSRAAQLLGISRPRLYRRMKELGIDDVPEPGDDAVRDRPLSD